VCAPSLANMNPRANNWSSFPNLCHFSVKIMDVIFVLCGKKMAAKFSSTFAADAVVVYFRE